MKDFRIILVGGGGFGREVISWCADFRANGEYPEVFGFIDDNESALKNFDYGTRYLGGIAAYQPCAEDLFLLGIANPLAKEKIVEVLRSKGGRFVSLVHPSAVVARTAQLGEGVVVCPFALVSADTRIGNFVTINVMSSIGHDSQVGDFSTLSGHVDVTGQVVVGSSVFFGTGAKILPRIKIGSRAIIGAGSTVVRSVPLGTTMYAAPAKRLSIHKPQSEDKQQD